MSQFLKGMYHQEHSKSPKRVRNAEGPAVSPSRFHLLSDDIEEGEFEAESSEEEDSSEDSIVADNKAHKALPVLTGNKGKKKKRQDEAFGRSTKQS